ncbi:MAG: hypothetical protein Q9186_007565 [Xanthomendoza sp. 1 TL-2023]
MTPSETLLSPPGTMLDISQHGSSGLPEVFTPSSSDIAMLGEALPVVGMPNTPLIFGHQWMGEPTSRPEDGQDEWAATVHSHIGVQYQNTSWPQSDNEISLTAVGMAALNQYSYLLQNHRVHEHLAAFEQAYRDDHTPDQGQPPTKNTNDGPPSMDAAAWTPWALNREQWSRNPAAQDLLYDPPTDLYLAGPDYESLAFREGYTEELDHNVSSGPDRYQVSSVTPEDNIDPPPPPDPIGPPSQLTHENSSCTHKAPKAKTNKGRRYQPLSPHCRQKAKMTRRNQGQCWSCALQRNDCKFENESDEICIGCKKKVKKSLIPDCIRLRLPDLTSVFIPASLAEQHSPENLRRFASTRVRCWLDNHFIVFVTWGYFRHIKVDVTEIESVGSSLLVQNQYRLNLSTHRYDLVQISSPPLGMVLMNVGEWRGKIDAYIEDLLREGFWRFPEACFRGDDCRVERDFLLPIFEYHEAATEKAKPLVHLSLKLVVLTFIMTHSLTLVEDTKDDVYEQLRNPPAERFGQHTCARWLNKQIKFLLSTLHRDLLKEVLNKVQETLRSSNKKPLWAPLFACMVILAMTTETLQVSVRCKEETDKGEGTINQDDKTADEAIALMDDKYDFLKKCFHQGYGTLRPKGLNPLRSPQDRTCLEDGASQSLAEKASDIIETYCKFIQRALARRGAEARR